MIRFYCDVCSVEIPMQRMSTQHTCSWCGRHSCYDHILVDVFNNSACKVCAKSRIIRVRKANEKTGTEQLLGLDD